MQCLLIDGVGIIAIQVRNLLLLFAARWRWSPGSVADYHQKITNVLDTQQQVVTTFSNDTTLRRRRITFISTFSPCYFFLCVTTVLLPLFTLYIWNYTKFAVYKYHRSHCLNILST